MNLSVVINTYERPGPLARCLAALAPQARDLGAEVIVVADGGRADYTPVLDAVRAEIPAIQFDRIEHKGPGGPRNRGVEMASGERVLFLGDDVMVQPGCLARHFAIGDSMTALLGPYPWKGLAGSPPFRRWAEPNPQWKIDTPSDAGFQYFCTGNLSMDRAVFHRLGGFDERYPCYGWEDIDLGLAFEREGGRIVFDAEARATHEHPYEDRRALWGRERAMGYTAWLFWEKWSRVDPALTEFMIFWDDPAAIQPVSPWRRRLGEAGVALLDALAPDSALNWKLYERLIFSHRLEGVAAAWRDRGRNQGGAPL